MELNARESVLFAEKYLELSFQYVILLDICMKRCHNNPMKMTIYY